MILDGNSIVNRAFYGIRLLTNKDGVYTNAIYGFLNILFKYISEENPTHLCVAFDVHAPTFRHKAFSEYKAQRKGMPDELRQQMPILKDILSAMNIRMLELEGYEADDIIGTVSRICDENNIICNILTGDKDDLQLASKNTIVKLITTKNGVTDTVNYTDDTVFDKYGVTPTEFIDVKGLMGDTSDNIPGVSGIGEKTAFSLIQKFKSIENIYENIDDSSISKGVRTKLTEGKEDAFDSKFLATIDRNVPIDFNIEDCIIKEYNNKLLVPLFTNLNFTSFLKKLDIKTEKASDIKISDNKDTLFENINDKKELFYYFDNDVCYAATSFSDITRINISDITDYIKNEEIKKISHNIKEHILYFNKINISYENGYFDTMIAYYILNPSATDYSLDTVALEILGSTDSNKLVEIISLYEKFKVQIKENNQTKLFYDIEMPLVEVLASMQINGVTVDKNNLLQFQSMLSLRIDEITNK